MLLMYKADYSNLRVVHMKRDIEGRWLTIDDLGLNNRFSKPAASNLIASSTCRSEIRIN